MPRRKFRAFQCGGRKFEHSSGGGSEAAAAVAGHSRYGRKGGETKVARNDNFVLKKTFGVVI